MIRDACLAFARRTLRISPTHILGTMLYLAKDLSGLYYTYDELLVPDCYGESAIECDPEVVGIITLIRDDMF